jgi:signal transduction histidine kinase
VRGDGVYFSLVLPLNPGEKPTGTLSVRTSNADIFMPDEVEMLQSLADQIAKALENVRAYEGMRQRADQLSVLSNVNLLIAAGFDMDTLAQGVQEAVNTVMQADCLTLALYDPDPPTLVVHIYDGGKLYPARIFPHNPSESIMSWIIEKRRPLMWQSDAEREKLDFPFRLGGNEKVPASFAGVPIMLKNKIVGAISVQAYQGGAFDQDDFWMIQTLANNIAITLENNQLYVTARDVGAELEKRSQRLASIHRIMTAVTSTLDSEEILGIAAERLVNLLEVEHCGVTLFDKDYEAGIIAIEYPDEEMAGMRVEVAENPLFAPLIEGKKYVFIRDTLAQGLPRRIAAYLDKIGVKSKLLLPLRAHGRLFGAVGLDMLSAPHEFSEEEIELAQIITNQIAMSIHNANLYREALVANRLKSQFLANVSHELRTPMNTIIGYGEMLLGGTYGALNEKQKDRLQRVYNSSMGLLALIDDVLDFSKIEAGQMQLEVNAVKVGPALRGLAGALEDKAASKGLTLKVEIEENLPAAAADETRLRQIFYNLLSNAIKFTQEGGVKINACRIEVQGGQIVRGSLAADRYALRDGSWLAVSVADSGIGIAKEDQKAIFDAFRQVDGSSRRKYEGTGLGLAITHQLVEMQNGRIFLESTPGQGSTFTVLLPTYHRREDGDGNEN